MITISELEQNSAPEIVLMILVCRVFLGTATADEIQKFVDSRELNWELFYVIVRTHRIRPIINEVLKGVKINEATAEKIKADCKQLVLKNFEHYRELLRLAGLFQEAGIMAVPYKGSIFSLQFYDEISLREVSDMDFLIRDNADGVSAIARMMSREGYTTGFEVPEKFREFYFNHVREFKFIYYNEGKRKFLAEFHSSLNDQVFETTVPVTNNFLFADLKEETFSNSNIRTLSPTKHFLAMLTHHGIREQWTSAKNLMDLAMVIRTRDKVNWELIDEWSRTYRFRKNLAIGLKITDDLLGVNIGLPLEKTETGPWIKVLFSMHLNKVDRTWRNNFTLKLKSKDTTSDKSKMIYNHLGYMATPSILDYKFIKLPKRLFFLYVLIKPIRMLVRATNSKNR